MTLEAQFNDLIAPYKHKNFTCASLCIMQPSSDADTPQSHQYHWGEITHNQTTQPVTDQTWYDLASVSKLYNTTAFLSLIAEGRVTLSTPLAEILPEFATINPRAIAGGQNPHTAEIEPPDPHFAGQTIDPTTISFQHLITHTSGLPPWRDVYNASPPPPPPYETDDLTIAQRLQNGFERLVAYPFVGLPDEVRYSDIGMMLIGFATAHLHNPTATLADAVQARVLTPIADTISCYNPVRQHNIPLSQIAPAEYDSRYRHRLVWGEVHDENACGIGGIAGHAGLFSNASSVANFGYTWLTQPQKFGITPDLARQATSQQAQTDAHSHGLGWMMKSPDSSSGELFSANAYGHTGFTGTSLWVDPDRQLVVAFLTNRVVVGRDVVGIHACRRAVHDWVVQTFT